jgi:hypothetical protein
MLIGWATSRKGEIVADLDWILNKMPRGRDLPIACMYEFSKGKSAPDASDLPEDWRIAGSEVEPEDIVAAGWPEYFASIQGKAKLDGLTFIFLKNNEEEIVATWDEGRWWTPDESAAFTLMGTTPAAYALAEQNRISKLPRAIRRKLGYK